MSEFDRHAANYTEQVDAAVAFSGQNAEFFNELKAQHIVGLAREVGGRVLDVGCGIGMIHRALASHGLTISGVDVSASSLQRAAFDNPECTYLHYEGNRLPFANDSFDLAYAVCVMHHVSLEQRMGFLGEMYRVIRPGGLIAILEHNPFNPLTRYVVRNCPMDANAVLLTRGEILSMLRRSGCRKMRSGFILFTPFKGEIFRRLDRTLRRLPLGAQYWAAGCKPDSSYVRHIK